MDKALLGRWSSRLLRRVLKKAQLPATSRGLSQQECKSHLHTAHKNYFSIRKTAPELRLKHLESRAAAWAAHENLPKEKILKQLIERETLRSTHRKIKFLRGKLDQCSITMVTLLDESQRPKDLIQK